MKRTITLLAACALLTLGGCYKKSENPPPSAGTSSGTAVPAGSANAPAAGSGTAAGSGAAAGSATAAGSGSAAAPEVDVPTEMDFEADATAKITDKNVEAEVQALEKQLEQK
jgi:uncharacterized lipoprotein NlpE involved in copper resistance